MITPITLKPISAETIAESAIIQLVKNIIIVQPKSIARDVTKLATLLFKL